MSYAILAASVITISVLAVPVHIGFAGGGDVEQRIADFWKRVDALQPGDFLSSADLGQWALNVIERNPRARTTVADFRVATAGMQSAMDQAGLAPTAPPGTPAPSGTVEQRIADFWKRVDSLQPTDFLSAADLGQWALNVIERNPRARMTVADFRVSAAGMQGGMDRAGLAPAPPSPTPGRSATPAPTGSSPPPSGSPTPTPSGTATPTASPIPTSSLSPSATPLASATPTATATTAPGTSTIGGLTFRVSVTANADFYAETSISDADTATLASLVEPAIAYLQVDFGRAYASRAQIYAFGSDASFATGWSSVLGGLGQPAGAYGGVFIPNTGKVGLNWPAMKTSQPYRTVRHELTHKLEHQLARDLPFPAWFDEGMARLEDLSVPGGAYRIMESRVSVGSAAANGTLQNVTSLTDLQFYSLTGAQGAYAYYEAAETVRLIQFDLTQAGIVRILELVGSGQTFEAAYAAVSGRSFTSFAGSRTARLAQLAPSPGIATAGDTSTGPGMSFIVYGLAPSTSFTLDIVSGAASRRGLTATTNAFGLYLSYLGSTWPPGTYRITVTTPSLTLTSDGIKTSSVDASVTVDESDDLLTTPALFEAVEAE